jgi:hypothetical protein
MRDVSRPAIFVYSDLYISLPLTKAVNLSSAIDLFTRPPEIWILIPKAFKHLSLAAEASAVAVAV